MNTKTSMLPSFSQSGIRERYHILRNPLGKRMTFSVTETVSFLRGPCVPSGSKPFRQCLRIVLSSVPLRHYFVAYSVPFTPWRLPPPFHSRSSTLIFRITYIPSLDPFSELLELQTKVVPESDLFELMKSSNVYPSHSALQYDGPFLIFKYSSSYRRSRESSLLFRSLSGILAPLKRLVVSSSFWVGRLNSLSIISARLSFAFTLSHFVRFPHSVHLNWLVS